MGHDAAHEDGFGRIPQQDVPQADREATAEGTGWRMGLPPSGECNGRGGLKVGGHLRLPPLENSRTVYCD